MILSSPFSLRIDLWCLSHFSDLKVGWNAVQTAKYQKVSVCDFKKTKPKKKSWTKKICAAQIIMKTIRYGSHLGSFFLRCDHQLSELGQCLTQFDGLTSVTHRTHDLDLFSKHSRRLVINFVIRTSHYSHCTCLLCFFFFPLWVFWFFYL